MVVYLLIQAEDREEEKAASPADAKAAKEDTSKVEATDNKKKAAEVATEEGNGEASGKETASADEEKGWWLIGLW